MASRRAIFAVLVAASLLVATAAIVSAVRGGESAASASTGARAALTAARSEGRPVMLARNVDGGGAEPLGQVAIVPLGATPGRRVLSSLHCDRLHFAGGRGLCLARATGFAAGYRARVFGPDLRMRHELDVEGFPSRARVSPDGRYGSVTLFVTGHSYAEGRFSTRTTLIDLGSGERIADLEEFTVMNGRVQVAALDVNFWGVTFARDSDRFYATMATGGETYLIVGSIRARSARVLHTNVECPSLSPDGRRIAYKHRARSAKAPWRLTVLDLATMRETPLAETRSVDDQVEWLDDDRVLYGIDRTVYAVRVDGTGTPSRFLADADSPAVVHW